MISDASRMDQFATAWSSAVEIPTSFTSVRTPPKNTAYNEPYPLSSKSRKRGPISSNPTSYSASPTELPSSPNNYHDQPLLKKIKYSENFLPTLIEKMSVDGSSARDRGSIEDTSFSSESSRNSSIGTDTSPVTTESFKSKYLLKPLQKIEEDSIEALAEDDTFPEDSFDDEDIFEKTLATNRGLQVNVPLPQILRPLPMSSEIEKKIYGSNIKNRQRLHSDPTMQVVLYTPKSHLPKTPPVERRSRANAIGHEDALEILNNRDEPEADMDMED